MRQELLVLLLHGGPVGAVHVGVVEEVAVDPPGLGVDLLPLGPRVDANFDGVQVEPAAAFGLTRRARRRRGATAAGPAARTTTTTGHGRHGGCRAAAATAGGIDDEPAVRAAGVKELAAIGS